MNADLERLMDVAVADGRVTDQERGVLHRKAKELGVDPDEVDMVLEGKLLALRGKVEGKKLTKCPGCGASISGLSRVCGDCKYVFDDGGHGGAPDLHKIVERLLELLAELKAIPMKGAGDAIPWLINPMGKLMSAGGMLGGTAETAETRYANCLARIDKERRIALLYYGSDPTVKTLIADIDQEVSKREAAVAQGAVKTRNFLIAMFAGSLLILVVLAFLVANQ